MLKVCVVGTAPGSRLIAPYDDQSYEIWACSAGNSQASALPRVTKWFELHAMVDMIAAENKVWSKPYFDWLRAQTFPVYMQEHNDVIPRAIVFPYKALCERFGPNPKKGLANWFTSSIAWMIGFAITQMAEGDEIAIFGVDMAAAEEHYTAQKHGIQRMIEYARAAGIKVKIPYESCLGKTYPLYGYSEATNMGRKLNVRLDEMTKIRQQIDQQCKQFELQRAYFDGALEGVKYDIRTWTDGMDAELDMGESEGFGEEMKGAAAKAIPLTREFTENSAGVFVPKSISANMSSLPEGSTVSVDAAGKKHYGMVAEPGKLQACDPGMKRTVRKRNTNGVAAEQ